MGGDVVRIQGQEKCSEQRLGHSEHFMNVICLHYLEKNQYSSI